MTEKCCPHCGCHINMRRSHPDHARYFGLVSAAYMQWPEQHRFEPDNAEHLRGWLTAAAGHRVTTRIEIPDIPPDPIADAVAGAIKAAKGTAFVFPRRGAVSVISPKSIAWDQAGQSEFAAVRDAVTAVIEREIGVSADSLLRERANAA